METWMWVVIVVANLIAYAACAYAGYQYGYRRGFDAGEEYQYQVLKQEMAELQEAHEAAIQRIEDVTKQFTDELGDRGKEWLDRWQRFS
jgi:hypothetical protein